MSETIVIEHSGAYQSERSYIFSVIFSEFLGIEFEEYISEIDNVQLTLKGDSEKKLDIADVLFNTLKHNWLEAESMPAQPLKIWDASEFANDFKSVTNNIPVIYGNEIDNKCNSFYKRTADSIEIGIDLFGSAFFMLTRYEEIVNKDRDNHNRFSACASIAYKENFLERPIINEYVEILWYAIKTLWPGLKRKKRKYNVQLSHDVDHPLYTHGKNAFELCKNLAGDLVKRRSIGTFLRNLKSLLVSNNHRSDPYNTFDFIMDISEKNNITSTFYFITDQTDNEFDSKVYINIPFVFSLLEKINKRGHNIGLHPSYSTYMDLEQLKKEIEILLSTLNDLNLNVNNLGARQHYLRWKNPTTWQFYDDADLDFDNTLTYADHAGFRSGICYEYPTFNLRTRKKLKLVEKPLIVMEGTVLGKHYMNLPTAEASKYIKQLSEICKTFEGDFTFLVHNNSLYNNAFKLWYENLVSEIS